jgi:hypothetical protein
VINKILSKLKQFRTSFLLTGRGLIFIALSVYAIRYLAIPENDLLAWILGGVAGFLPIFLAALTTFQFFRLKKQISAKAHFDNIEAVSSRPVNSGLRISDGNPYSFFELEIERNFEHSGPNSPIHVLRGSESDTRYLIDSTTFPHRGVWRVNKLNCTIGDRFGFSRLNFKVPCLASCEVDAPVIPIAPLPIVASSSVTGDLIESTNNRSGDPFDIKQYDPSEGISRILWKTFAKSGELVVRRPEPSVIPDGEVVVYVVANKNDDHVVGGFLSYYQLLMRNQIAVLFGTDGTDAGIFSEPSTILKALNESVWTDGVGTGNDIGNFLNNLTNSGRTVLQIIIFGPDDRDDWLKTVQRELSSRSLKGEFAIMPVTFRNQISNKKVSTPKIYSTSFNDSLHICQESLG